MKATRLTPVTKKKQHDAGLAVTLQIWCKVAQNVCDTESRYTERFRDMEGLGGVIQCDSCY